MTALTEAEMVTFAIAEAGYPEVAHFSEADQISVRRQVPLVVFWRAVALTALSTGKRVGSCWPCYVECDGRIGTCEHGPLDPRIIEWPPA